MELLDKPTRDAIGTGSLSEEQALEIYRQGSEAVIFVLLELAKQLAEARGPPATPSTPSGMIAVYKKTPAKSRQKRPGAEKGHPGSRRAAPDRIDWEETHQAPCCPDCGGLIEMWYRLQAILYLWYEEIQRQALKSAVLHGDETGWRVSGKTFWLWCFTTRDLTYYLIDRSRGSPALMKFFIEEFAGTLVTDFWGAYNAVCCAARQMCLVHLLRDLEHVDKYKRPGEHWPAFAKQLRRLIGDAIRLWRRRDELTAGQYQSRRDRLHKRLAELIDSPWEDPQAIRLIKRLRRHREDLFTFVDQPEVPFDNNHAERMIRPAVIIRKNSYGNRSQRGADCQAVLMSVFRTLKQRGHDPIRPITNALALATYIKTGKLPPLLENIPSDG